MATYPAALLPLVLGLTGCRVSDAPLDDWHLLDSFAPPLRIGHTTREACLLRFGVPMERFEDDRILCWRVMVDAATQQPISVYVSPWYAAPEAAGFTQAQVDPRVRVEPTHVASLVLVFDDAGVLRRAKALRQP